MLADHPVTWLISSIGFGSVISLILFALIRRSPAKVLVVNPHDFNGTLKEVIADMEVKTDIVRQARVCLEAAQEKTCQDAAEKT